eukprot:gene12744-biopygen6986
MVPSISLLQHTLPSSASETDRVACDGCFVIPSSTPDGGPDTNGWCSSSMRAWGRCVGSFTRHSAMKARNVDDHAQPVRVFSSEKKDTDTV